MTKHRGAGMEHAAAGSRTLTQPNKSRSAMLYHTVVQCRRPEPNQIIQTPADDNDSMCFFTFWKSKKGLKCPQIRLSNEFSEFLRNRLQQTSWTWSIINRMNEKPSWILIRNLPCVNSEWKIPAGTLNHKYRRWDVTLVYVSESVVFPSSQQLSFFFPTVVFLDWTMNELLWTRWNSALCTCLLRASHGPEKRKRWVSIFLRRWCDYLCCRWWLSTGCFMSECYPRRNVAYSFFFLPESVLCLQWMGNLQRKKKNRTSLFCLLLLGTKVTLSPGRICLFVSCSNGRQRFVQNWLTFCRRSNFGMILVKFVRRHSYSYWICINSAIRMLHNDSLHKYIYYSNQQILINKYPT